MTQTRLTPTAVIRGRTKASVSNGAIRIPPPRPSNEPKRPAATPPPRSTRPTISLGPAAPRACSRRGLRLAPGRAARLLGPEVLRRVWEQRDDPSPLQRDGQLALVLGARAGLPTWLDLRSLGNIAAEAVDLLVVDRCGLFRAERADLPPSSVSVVVVTLLGARGRHSGSPRGSP